MFLSDNICKQLEQLKRELLADQLNLYDLRHSSNEKVFLKNGSLKFLMLRLGGKGKKIDSLSGSMPYEKQVIHNSFIYLLLEGDVPYTSLRGTDWKKDYSESQKEITGLILK